jgi:hypothetical protein
MKFVLLNGRTPCPQSFCALCFGPIGETYLRELTARLSYCDRCGRSSSEALGRSPFRSSRLPPCEE